MDKQSSVKRHIICGVKVEQTGREVGRMKDFVASLAAVRPPRQERQVPVAAESFGPLVAKATLISQKVKTLR